MAPFLSIVTVSLNAADTIEATLASVALQRSNFQVEHICVDGGSTDSTRLIIDRWAARNSRLMRVYESDSGIFDAMNKGLRKANGEYVLFLNADDFLLTPDSLSTALAECAVPGNAMPDLIVGNAIMGGANGIGFWRHRKVPKLLSRFRGFGMYPVHQGQFSRRQLLIKVAGFDSKLRLAADINQYYDIERLLRPSIRQVGADLVFMQAGGAANAGIDAIWLGTLEIYRHLSTKIGRAKALVMVFVKTVQSLSELRFGRCPRNSWFKE